MSVIKVATDNGNAYYEIVSRLKRTHLRFSSLAPGSAAGPTHDLVITSKPEAPAFGDRAIAIEDLSVDPLVMEGQLLSRLVDESKRDLLIGIDPGRRIGVAVFYGGRPLGGLTLDSVEKTVEFLATLAKEVLHSSLSVKIGAGEPASSRRLARELRERLSASALVEVVNESGTSNRRGTSATGGSRDQRAAARIAFRKGRRLAPS